MIAKKYGINYSLQEYRKLTKTDIMGVNIYGLVDGANRIGMNAESLKGDFEEMVGAIKQGEIKLPLIAHIITENGNTHFVVVYKIKNKKIYIADPAKGKCIYYPDEFKKKWTGYIVVFNVEHKISQEKGTTSEKKVLKGLLKGQYRFILILFLASILISCISIAGTYIFEIVINQITAMPLANNGILEFMPLDKIGLNLFFAGIIIVYIIQSVIQLFRGMLIAKISSTYDIRLMTSYYNHLVEIPMSDLSTRKTAEYISRFADARTIKEVLSNTIVTIVLDTLMALICGVLLYIKNYKLFLITLVIVIIYIIIVLLYRKPISNINFEVMESNAKVQSYLKESIDGLEDIKAMSAENILKRTLFDKYVIYVNKIFKSSIIYVTQDSLCLMIELIGTVLVLWMGFTETIYGKMTVGEVITFYALLSYFIVPIKNLIKLQSTIQGAIIAWRRLSDIYYIKKENKNGNGIQEVKRQYGNIKFNNVNFRYGNRREILRNINFEIKRGEKIGIVGESGSGKTTLAKLILGFYESESGSIMIDGENIINIPLGELRQNISYVSYNPFLFSDTILNNLKFATPDVSEKQFMEVCKACSIDEFVSKLGQGYHTVLEENGRNISSGQRQRIAIARELLKNPQLLILDEATNNLDTITEDIVKRSIYDLNREMSYIIISHHLPTTVGLDKIIVLHNGEIVDIGTHEQLLLNCEYYSLLWNKQK